MESGRFVILALTLLTEARRRLEKRPPAAVPPKDVGVDQLFPSS